MLQIQKPIAPIYPDIRDRKKYPLVYGKKLIDSPYIVDCKKYQKDHAKYIVDIQVWEQTKFIEDIKRSSLKLCLKKYSVSKR